MSIPVSIDPLGTLEGVDVPYIQPVYNNDATSLIVEPSVATTITATEKGWSDPNPLFAFRGNMTPMSYFYAASWFKNGNKMTIVFAKPVRLTKVSVLPAQHFDGRYMKGYRVLADGVDVGSVTGLQEEDPVNWHDVQITNPRHALKIELVFQVATLLSITQVVLTGTHKQ